MRTLLVGSAAVAMLSSGTAALAQTLQGSAGIGIGAADNQFHDYSRIVQATGGAELHVTQRFAVGGELGVAAGGGDAWVPLSLNGTYYLPATAASGLMPYLSGGFTWLNFVTDVGHDRAYDVGGGVVLWGSGRTGLRVEVRDVIRPGESFNTRGLTRDVWPTRHWLSINLAVAFR